MGVSQWELKGVFSRREQQSILQALAVELTIQQVLRRKSTRPSGFTFGIEPADALRRGASQAVTKNV